MIVEQRIYTLKAGKTAAYLSLYREEGLEIQTHHLGRLMGYFTSEFGPLNQIIHMWAYEDHAERERRRAALFADQRWMEVVGRLYEMIASMENRIFTPTSFSPIR